MKLLGAQEPFLQRSGAKRVRRLADSDDLLRALLREQAPARLLALLHADADAGEQSCRILTDVSMQLLSVSFHDAAAAVNLCSWDAVRTLKVRLAWTCGRVQGWWRRCWMPLRPCAAWRKAGKPACWRVSPFLISASLPD